MKNIIRHIIKENLILEGRKEDAYNKYKDEIEAEKATLGDGITTAYEDFVSEDPSGNHKYLDWLMRMWYGGIKQAQRRGYAVLDLIEMVEDFHKYSNQLDKKDITQWKDLGELYEALEVIKAKYIVKEKEKKVIKVDSGHPDYEVYIPETWEASCKYGMGTKWCTAMRDTNQYFRDYSRDGVLYYIIDKTKKEDHPLYKIAVSVKNGPKEPVVWNNKEIFNAPDKKIGSNLEYFVPDVVNKSILRHWESNIEEQEELDLYSIIQNHIGTNTYYWEGGWRYASDTHVGNIEWWKPDSNIEVSVFATPFWEDEDGVPVDISWYDENDDFQTWSRFIAIDTDFESAAQVREWFEGHYPYIVMAGIRRFSKETGIEI